MVVDVVVFLRGLIHDRCVDNRSQPPDLIDAVGGGDHDTAGVGQFRIKHEFGLADGVSFPLDARDRSLYQESVAHLPNTGRTSCPRAGVEGKSREGAIGGSHTRQTWCSESCGRHSYPK